MTRNSDLEMLLAELDEENLRKLGEPPGIEQLEAYMRDELPEGEEKERVRAMIVAYPELARAVALWPGDDDELSDDDVDHHWAAMREEIGLAARDADRGRVLQFRSAFPAAIAAALAITFGGLFWHAEWRLTRPTVAWNETLLSPDGRRGGADTPVTLTPAGNSFFLVVPLIGQAPFIEYRLEITDGEQSLWRSADLRRSADDSFAMLVPRSFLKPGTYQVVLYGEDGEHDVKVATYSVRVPAR